MSESSPIKVRPVTTLGHINFLVGGQPPATLKPLRRQNHWDTRSSWLCQKDATPNIIESQEVIPSLAHDWAPYGIDKSTKKPLFVAFGVQVQYDIPPIINTWYLAKHLNYELTYVLLFLWTIVIKRLRVGIPLKQTRYCKRKTCGLLNVSRFIPLISYTHLTTKEQFIRMFSYK